MLRKFFGNPVAVGGGSPVFAAGASSTRKVVAESASGQSGSEADFGAGKATLPGARLYLLDENNKIKTEHVIFYAAQN